MKPRSSTTAKIAENLVNGHPDEPLIPAGAVIDKKLVIKSSHTGATFIGSSVEEILASMRYAKFEEPKLVVEENDEQATISYTSSGPVFGK